MTTTHNAKLDKQIQGMTDPDKIEAAEELVEALGQSRDYLTKATTVFPLTLFPDTVTIDRAKIAITRRYFLRAGEVVSIAIEDVLNVSVHVGPFFGKIKITTRFFDPDKGYEVDHFLRDDALRIGRVIQGYLIARKQEIDTTALSDKELSRILNELGKNHPRDEL